MRGAAEQKRPGLPSPLDYWYRGRSRNRRDWYRQVEDPVRI
jgi:hypothetical protein